VMVNILPTERPWKVFKTSISIFVFGDPSYAAESGSDFHPDRRA
jgi:hypothetical protein